jgi:protein SCO1/2
MRFRSQMSGAAIAALVAFAVPAASASEGDDVHAHHHLAAATTTTRTLAQYVVPNVAMTREDGAAVRLNDELNDGRPVVLAFIYTSCTTVCPLISHTLSELQNKLGADRDRVHLVSITIDPEQDTPSRLREYAKTFHAGPGWQHYTGTLAASQTVQRAFGVYRGNKMDHSPATLVRRAPGDAWARLEGFATASDLLSELPDFNGLRAAR